MSTATDLLYHVWKGAVYRCHKSKPGQYYYAGYRGRGITVCAEWRNNYLAFKEWALTNGYVHGLTLDRVDNNLGYSPENCAWKTRAEQQQNTNSNKYVTIDGVTKLLKHWAEEYQMDYYRAYNRIKRGWDPVRALTQGKER